MKRLVAKLTLMSMFLVLSPAGLLAGQAKGSPNGRPAPFTFGQRSVGKLPPQAVAGSTPERRAAWEKLTPEQRQQHLKRFEELLRKPLQAAAAQHRKPKEPKGRWVRSDLLGKKIRSVTPGASASRGTLALTDRFGAVSSIEPMRPIDEDPGEFYPPEVSVSASPVGGAAPLTVQLNSFAYDPDGWVTSYYWDLGDGAVSYDPYPVHTYTAPGFYTAWLTVTDNSGMSAWAAVNISVTDGGNLPPTVAAGGSPLSGFAPLNVAFNAAAFDPDGWITSYFWSFGDGQTSNEAAPAHTYQSAGSFTASVTVTDNAGATATASVGVQVTAVSGSGADADGDSLADDFEERLSDAFTPVYHVSAGEQWGTGFARFGDFVPQTVTQFLPPVPPLTHVRVTPVGFATDIYGRQLGFLQIDYLTIWNRDDGLDVGGFCQTGASILGGLIGLSLTGLAEGLGAHQIDDERSAVLVAAPVPAGFQYSADHSAYQAYDYYTAAHEGTFTDHSAYFGPWQPVPAYYHLNLFLTKAKHSTYSFNPNYYPLTPYWVMFTAYDTISFLYAVGVYDYYQYLIYLYIADTVFFGCFVEHFEEQGGWFPDLRLNVGELSHPINGSGFILDSRVSSKLTPLVWYIQ